MNNKHLSVDQAYELFKGKIHIVMMSSGVGSAVAGKRVAEIFGPSNVKLLFADVNMEDEDNYRFLREATEWVGSELITLDNEGRNIWDVFKESRFLGNSRIDPCSRVLKREPMRKWLESNCDPGQTVAHIGFDVDEEHRFWRSTKHWEPWVAQAPLCWDPVIWRDQAIDMVNEAGILPPSLTRDGFPHANCGGGCVKAGMSQFRKLYKERPETFREWRDKELEMQEFLGNDITILRFQKDKVKHRLSLKDFETVLQAEEKGLPMKVQDLLQYDEGGACNCMGEFEE